MNQNLLLKQCVDLAVSLKYERSIKIDSYVGRQDKPDKIVVTVEVRNDNYFPHPFYPHQPRVRAVCDASGPDLDSALIVLRNNLINLVKKELESLSSESSRMVQVLAKVGSESDIKI